MITRGAGSRKIISEKNAAITSRWSAVTKWKSANGSTPCEKRPIKDPKDRRHVASPHRSRIRSVRPNSKRKQVNFRISERQLDNAPVAFPNQELQSLLIQHKGR